jgi:hypothetical protein
VLLVSRQQIREAFRTMVEVHQVVRDLAGRVVSDQTVQHVYEIRDGGSHGWRSGNERAAACAARLTRPRPARSVGDRKLVDKTLDALEQDVVEQDSRR